MLSRIKEKLGLKTPLPISDVEKGLVYEPHRISAQERKEAERLFARVFLSEDGKKVLSYLQMITFQRALGAEASHEQLRYLEGQRAIVGTILRLIKGARRS